MFSDNYKQNNDCKLHGTCVQNSRYGTVIPSTSFYQLARVYNLNTQLRLLENHSIWKNYRKKKKKLVLVTTHHANFHPTMPLKKKKKTHHQQKTIYWDLIKSFWQTASGATDKKSRNMSQLYHSHFFYKTYRRPRGNSFKQISFSVHEQRQAGSKCLHDRYADLFSFFLST